MYGIYESDTKEIIKEYIFILTSPLKILSQDKSSISFHMKTHTSKKKSGL